MTRSDPVRFLRTEPTIAFPDGRLLALRGGRLYVLAPDGWTGLDQTPPAGATWLTRAEAEDWCATQGCDLYQLDELPSQF